MTRLDEKSEEDLLRAQLAQCDAMVGGLAPVLRHLLENNSNSLFSEEVIARVRGMLSDIARQLTKACVQSPSCEEDDAASELIADRIAQALIGDSALISHLHALSVEWQLAGKLHEKGIVDAVLSPLLQALIASHDKEVAGTAMRALAAQARFMQNGRRMEYPLMELPGDLFHTAVATASRISAASDQKAAEAAEKSLRSRYDEADTRLGLIAQLVARMGSGAIAALSLAHAGVAICLTALAASTGQDRDLVVLSTHERLLTRFAVALRAAGLKTAAIEEQVLILHSALNLPEGFEQLHSDNALSLLSSLPDRWG